ncbi:extracellular solute-binding protein [Curtobacterium sp. VKM Ac-1393]|uniref:extracellular solute-binding protein n=1 Tax=Curtobacterium sp. VKM Ac-1393 TaxID=2783814 RepID=UPI00188B72E3|nr:extracellular solute-binding protein [Curtobacterium sp. VKM Ac-1393]MBF4607607.1 extracellular solute-binding protein [Curtobacterium sp. VKM Ac-1393]
MRTSRLTALAGIAAAGALVLTGCSTASPAAEQSVAAAGDLSTCKPSDNTINVTFGTQAAEAMKIAAAKVEEEYPGLTINATPQSTSSYDDLTQKVVGDIAVGKRPDLIMTGLGQLRFWVDSYHPATIDESALPSTYQKQFLAAGTVDGETYLAPAQISTPVLLVNQDALDAAGAGNGDDIHTFDDLVTAAKKVTADTGSPSVSIPTQGLPDWFSQAFVQGAGDTFVADDGTAGFGTDQGAKDLSIWSDLAKDKLEAGVGDQDAMANFTSGKTAFLVYTTSTISTIQQGIGGAFAWKAVDLPTVNGGDGALPAGGNGWVVLSDDSCRAGYANALVGALLSKDAVLAASGTSYSYIPVDKAAAKELLSGDDVSEQQRYAWSYDKPLTQWGGFPGKSTKQVNDTLRQMAQGLQSGADTTSTVETSATAIDSIVRAAQ